MCPKKLACAFLFCLLVFGAGSVLADCTPTVEPGIGPVTTARLVRGGAVWNIWNSRPELREHFIFHDEMFPECSFRGRVARLNGIEDKEEAFRHLQPGDINIPTVSLAFDPKATSATSFDLAETPGKNVWVPVVHQAEDTTPLHKQIDDLVKTNEALQAENTAVKTTIQTTLYRGVLIGILLGIVLGLAAMLLIRNFYSGRLKKQNTELAPLRDFVQRHAVRYDLEDGYVGPQGSAHVYFLVVRDDPDRADVLVQLPDDTHIKVRNIKRYLEDRPDLWRSLGVSPPPDLTRQRYQPATTA